MRLRNIPRAQSVLSQCAEVIKNETEHKGSWQEIFGNSHPIHIEIGMGKGKFLLSLASLHPEINYIGIERYSRVLLRAVESSRISLSAPRLLAISAFFVWMPRISRMYSPPAKFPASI